MFSRSRVLVLVAAAATLVISSACNDIALYPVGGGGSSSPTATPVREIPPPPIASGRLAIAKGSFDDIEVVLRNVGADDIETFISWDLLTDLYTMNNFDGIFINSGANENDGSEQFGLLEVDVLDNIRAYVDGGGSLYASGKAYDFVEQAFPDAIEFSNGDDGFNAAQTGRNNDLVTDIADEPLATAFGRDVMNIHIDYGGWVVAESVNTRVGSGRVLLSAREAVYDVDAPPYNQATVPNAPLAAVFEWGAGRVLFTSVHYETPYSPELATPEYWQTEAYYSDVNDIVALMLHEL